MMDYVQLDRKFTPLIFDKAKGHYVDSPDLVYAEKSYSLWESLLLEYRTVILAEAGSGKTVEFGYYAKALKEEGRFSFFIRIEDIDNDFIESFEVGDEGSFEEWLQSVDEAWFFLDSVDEARLEHPRKFEKAIKVFARKIRQGAHRCHVYISSRPYSWRFKDDESLLNTELYLASNESSEDQEVQQKNALEVYTLCPLNSSQIEQFCQSRSVENIEELLHEIQKFNLSSFAERPFDLENLIVKWNDDKALGSRTEVIQYNINNHLLDKHTQNRQSIGISLVKLEEGVQRLASIILLTGNANIKVPNSENNRDLLDASLVLPEWNESEIAYLLNCAIFNDVIYGAVRFRHREIREFLTAQWFKKLLNADDRLSIEGQFIREQFGEKIITPLLRPILPWLIPYDEKLRSKVLQIQPEIVFEGGDFSQLPLGDREKILEGVVERIASSQGHHRMMHNEDIARIAFKDLEDKTLVLIQKYSSSENVIFFLARLVWKGDMTRCLPYLLSIALDASSDWYTRLMCVRAIVDCGSRSDGINLWQSFNNNEDIQERKIISELVSNIEPDEETIKLLLISLSKLARPDRYMPSGFSNSLGSFIDKCDTTLSFELLVGISDLLAIAPFYERHHCKISKQYAWLLKSSLHLIIKLINAHSDFSFDNRVISILINVWSMEHQREDQLSYQYNLEQEKQELKELISNWPELNDSLYWNTIEFARAYRLEKKQERLMEDWCVCNCDDFWEFNSNSFERLIGYVQTKDLDDDKLIAFSRVFRIYTQNGQLEWMLAKLKGATDGFPELSESLKLWLNPTPRKDDERAKREEENRLRELKYAEQNHLNKLNRSKWINNLKENPDQLLTSSYFLDGELTNNHYGLMEECRKSDEQVGSRFAEGVDWKSLIGEFGESVAEAYRDSAIRFWRIYRPKLHSEEMLEKNTTPSALVFGLIGLEIEFLENQNFPKYLSDDEVENALRYITWEMNGFRSWFEKFYRVFPKKTLDALMKEVIWSLENSEHSLLYDLVYCAPWLHNDLASSVYDWLFKNPPIQHKETREHSLEILLNSDISSESFKELAQNKLVQVVDIKEKAWWYALLVDSDPDIGIPDCDSWLAKQNEEDAVKTAQVFIVHLIDGRNIDRTSINGRAGKNIIRSAKYLKQLYLLMHKYIKVEEDINRSGSGIYSPNLRDKAQDSRDLIFRYLREVPSTESYYAIKELADLDPTDSGKTWLNQVAYSIAVSCGNLDVFSVDQILQLEKSGAINPKSHKQLYDLAVLRINELKDWLENGGDSVYQMWQRVAGETEMRNSVASELRKASQNKYSIAQEDEKANGQRTDIILDNPHVKSAVPIELKVLDKNWSGADLCERLRNQLVGDYLREETAGCGIFLLIAQCVEKTWIINGESVALNELETVLQNYWNSIAHEWPSIDSIKVIVIDLNKRSKVSKT